MVYNEHVILCIYTDRQTDRPNEITAYRKLAKSSKFKHFQLEVLFNIINFISINA